MEDVENVWLKPIDVMKRRRLKLLSQRSNPDFDPVSIISNFNSSTNAILSNSTNLKKNLKRKNPFSCGKNEEIDNEDDKMIKKKILKNDDVNNKDDICDIISSYQKDDDECEDGKRNFQEKSKKVFLSIENFGNSASLQNLDETSVKIYEENVSKVVKKPEIKNRNSSHKLPMDRILKSKLRFLIPSEHMNKIWPIIGGDESLGVSNFLTDNMGLNKNEKQRLQCSSMYYQFPSIPWLQLFPRMNIRQKIPNDMPLPKTAEKMIFSNWCESMTSSFQNIKQDICPYMYICCHQMTILFTKQPQLQQPQQPQLQQPQLQQPQLLIQEQEEQRELTVVITPTTRGFRKSLDDESIEYSLPFLNKNRRKSADGDDNNHKNSNNNNEKSNKNNNNKNATVVATNANNNNINNSGSSNNINDDDGNDDDDLETTIKSSSSSLLSSFKSTEGNDDDDEDDDDDDDDGEEWLENLGLSKGKYQIVEDNRSCLNSSSKNPEENYRRIDYRPASTVLIDGSSDCVAFFNFLLNSPNIISSVGHLATIPPTILAPSAFKGASLQSLKILNKGEIYNKTSSSSSSSSRSSSSSSQSSSSSSEPNKHQKRSILEILGPILPNNFENILNTLASACHEYSCSVTNLDETTSFNCLNYGGSQKVPEESDSKLVKCYGVGDKNGEDAGLVLHSNAIKSVEYKDNLYTWDLSV